MPHIKRPYKVCRVTMVAAIAGLSGTIMLVVAVWETRPQDSIFMTVEWLVILGWAALGIMTWSTGRQSRREISEDDRQGITLGNDPNYYDGLAERMGFEPTKGFHPYSLSRGAPSTTRPPLRGRR